MTIDLYTKSVLTVIAACLAWLCFGAVTPRASAQTDVQRVFVVGWDRPLPAVVVDRNGTPQIGEQGLRVNVGPQPLPVTLGNRSLPVTLTAIQRTGNWQPIIVDVLKQPPTLRPTP